MESDTIHKALYLVKDLSSLSGLSAYTIKYYLKLGLIKEVGRFPETNFRYFDDSTLEALRRVIDLRKDDISLSKIRHIMDKEAHP
jgi:DNA-binding transcriptional MerR regulator